MTEMKKTKVNIGEPSPRKTKEITINPREPLTKKANAAISKYAAVKGDKLNYHHFMVKFVLEAERMKRVRLYAWLQDKGYIWKPRLGLWVKVK